MSNDDKVNHAAEGHGRANRPLGDRAFNAIDKQARTTIENVKCETAGGLNLRSTTEAAVNSTGADLTPFPASKFHRVELLMAAARGYCTFENRHKGMDSQLVEAIVSEIIDVLRPEMQAIAVERMNAVNRDGMLVHLRKERGLMAEELELERMRLAACGTAALGYFTGCKSQYESASLHDILSLRTMLQRTLNEKAELQAQLDAIYKK